jgi:iron complex transport system substrate-binding protein
MDKNGRIIGAIVTLCFIFLSPTGCAEETISPSDTVTIVDGTGQSVDVSRPVMRIVSITSRTSEIICALGAGDRIVGRDSYSIVPSSLEDVPVVAGSSYTPNVELILELEPDLVIADSMLSDDYRRRVEDAGIPVILETSWDPTTVATVVSHLGIVLDKEDRADEIISFIEQYHDIVEERCADLEEEEMPVVFFEWSQPYHSGASGTLFHNLTVASGGINVVADEPAKYPTVSPEWLAERDPDVILRLVSSTEDLTEVMVVEARDEIISRPGLSSVKAVEDERVYILSSPVTTGVRSIVGELYLAKWFHPDLFEDINPEEVHEELVQQFYGLELEGVYVYP